MFNRIGQVGEELGIKFTNAPDRLIFPTMQSHRLIELAKRQGKQDECMEGVFAMYFRDLLPLNSNKELVKVAEAVGVTGAKAYLESNEDMDKIKYEASQWKGSVNGVPHFFFYLQGSNQPRLSFSGAQPAAMFVKAIAQLLARKKL